ncbi:MAG TPA: fasciclin domain-containing protein [Sphingomicrobium sp.]|nr:fasciclin domain-containing protein [Sphingomicrobium sp.]
MLKSSLPLCLCAAALAVGACTQNESNTAAPVQNEAVAEQTIIQSLDQNSRFFQAARAVGLDSTLGGAGPYTVLVPSDEAFAGLEEGALADPADPQNRASTTRILTYHILPGVILAEDISKAIDNGEGRAVLATMGGETLTATKEDGTVVLADAAGGKARIVEADQKASNGVIHRTDAVLMPATGAEGADQQVPD